MKILALTRANTTRMIRDRSSIFFVFILPLALVLLIGLQFGGEGGARLGVLTESEGDHSRLLLAELERRVADIRRYPDLDSLVEGVERGTLEAAVTLPPGFDDRLTRGEAVEIGFASRPTGVGPSLRLVVEEALATVLVPTEAALHLSSTASIPYQSAERATRMVDPVVPRVDVIKSATGELIFSPTLGRFDLGASSQLLLFMFITALSGGAVLIETRQLGLSRRMLATPTSPATIVAGEAAGRFGVVLLQGLYIVAATRLIFDVNWGSLPASLAVVVAFSAVGAASAMLIGTLFRSAEQAGGIAVMAGLGLAALGGCMLPLQLFSDRMRLIAHVTPHAWGVDAFTEVVQRGAGIGGILVELGVLIGYAVVLGSIATVRMRKAIAG